VTVYRLRDHDPFPIVEAASAADLDAKIEQLSRRRDWIGRGESRAALQAEIDGDFINHDLHFRRMRRGGTREDGESFPGGGVLREFDLDVGPRQVEMRLQGSFEWQPQANVYDLTYRFMNFARIRRVRTIGEQRATFPDLARLLLRDNILVNCTCNAFRFYHRHAATQKGFSLVPERRSAPVNNPGNRGGVCKHLDAGLRLLGTNQQRIASVLKRAFGEQRVDFLLADIDDLLEERCA